MNNKALQQMVLVILSKETFCWWRSQFCWKSAFSKIISLAGPHLMCRLQRRAQVIHYALLLVSLYICYPVALVSDAVCESWAVTNVLKGSSLNRLLALDKSIKRIGYKVYVNPHSREFYIKAAQPAGFQSCVLKAPFF